MRFGRVRCPTPPIEPRVSESCWSTRVFMSDMEERTERATPRVAVIEPVSLDDEDPPGKPRRHPLWRNVPKKQWDDWRWQSQNAIRSVRQLRDLIPFSDEELEVMGDLEAEYKLAIPP